MGVRGLSSRGTSRAHPYRRDLAKYHAGVKNVLQEHIEVVEGAGGPKARIRGTRIRVQDIAVWHEKLGVSPDEIVSQYPSITLADVHAALAYYWDHREQMDRELGRAEKFVQELRRQHPSPLKEKLRRLGLA